jgi:dihydrolipoamide dehydrogenase
LLHATRLIREARESAHRGISFGEPQIDLAKLRGWKNGILEKLATGVATVAKMRGVEVLTGRGYFENAKTLRVETGRGQQFVTFEKAIIAVGSKAAMPKAFDLGNPRVMTSKQALEVEDIPAELLVIGGGYIGMELGTVYAALGSRVTVVEALGSILSGADADLARPVTRFAEKAFQEIRLNTKVAKMATVGKQIKVVFDKAGEKKEELYDRVLVSVGRAPNCGDLGLEHANVTLDDRGFIKVNAQQQTSAPDIFAIGDCVGGLMLAHKASREARIVVDVIAGDGGAFQDIIIPAVVFTEPEVAWAGLTEAEAKEKNIPVAVAKFPWSASGRAQTFDATDGLTKLIIDPETERILGVGIVGHGAGELISEGVLAIEMGATALDLAEAIHPHPTLSETMMEAAEVFYGHSTHLFARKKPD